MRRARRFRRRVFEKEIDGVDSLWVVRGLRSLAVDDFEGDARVLAASPILLSASGCLAGGVLTGKYLDVPAATDDADRTRGMANRVKPRGRRRWPWRPG